MVFFAPAEIAVAGDLGEQTRTRDRKLSAGCIDAFGRQLQIVVLFQRRADEFLQLRVLKYLPPGKIGIGGGLCLKLRIACQIAKSIRSLNRRAMIIRTDDAAGKHGRSQRCDEQFRDVSLGKRIVNSIGKPSAQTPLDSSAECTA